MKPLRLTVQAFGPFAGTEVVDFTNALNAGLFGIYGQTGAGKSSIFNAMTFALFGQTLREEQASQSLRSDQADSALITQVEFVFELGMHRYVARRMPEQFRPKRRGNGETKIAAEAYLFDATGLAIEEISEAKSGKVLAEKKVTEVNNALVSLLGYGLDQFRQIVLLPQGQFEKFLSATTKDRGEILEDLFDVSLFDRLTAALKEQTRSVEEQIKRQRDLCADRLAAEGFADSAALALSIEAASQSVTDHTHLEADARTARDAATKTLAEQITLAKAFTAAEEAQYKLQILEDAAEAMAALRARTGTAERARTALDAESATVEAQGRLSQAKQALMDSHAQAERAKDAERHAHETLRVEHARADETQALVGQRATMVRHKETLSTADSLRAQVTQATQAQSSATQALKASRDQYAATKSKLALLKDSAARADTARIERVGIEADLQTLSQAIQDVTAYTALQSRITEQETALATTRETHATLSAEAEISKAALDLATSRLNRNHALLLAAHLNPDQPCPVCGSSDHPAPAQGSAEDADLETFRAQCQERYEQLAQQLHAMTAQLAREEAVLQERRQTVRARTAPQETMADLDARRQKSEQRLEALGPSMDATAVHAEIEQLDLELEALLEKDKELSALETQKIAEAARLTAKLEERLADIPGSLRNLDILNTKIQELDSKIFAQQQAREQAEVTHQAAREANLTAISDVKAKEEALATAQDQAQTARSAFLQRLKSEGLTEETLAEIKPEIDQISAHRTRLDAYDADLRNAQERVTETRVLIADKSPPDLSTFESAQEDSELALSAASEARIRAQETLNRLAKLKGEIEDSLEALTKLEKETAPLRAFAAVCNGENPHRMDLKTFAIATYFDRVLDAANQRLYPMSGYRYLLERDGEIRGGGKKGLELQISDAHTGKSRSTATLSGGETFIAALALALGLADSVESTSGKVRLDTIFIDEGFGSLDTENGAGTLDQVLQTLTDLVSQNRAVGLISHVPLVQDRIPNGFYIRKKPGGSTIEARNLSA